MNDTTRRIGEMRAQGHSVMMIAEVLGVPYPQVVRHLGAAAVAQKAQEKRAEQTEKALRQAQEIAAEMRAAQEALARREAESPTREITFHMDMNAYRALNIMENAHLLLSESGSFWNGYAIAMGVEGNDERADAALSNSKRAFKVADEANEIVNEMRRKVNEATRRALAEPPR